MGIMGRVMNDMAVLSWMECEMRRDRISSALA